MDWIISRLTEYEVNAIRDNLTDAIASAENVLIAFDPIDNAFKFKVAGYWSPPFGRRDDGYGNDVT